MNTPLHIFIAPYQFFAPYIFEYPIILIGIMRPISIIIINYEA